MGAQELLERQGRHDPGGVRRADPAGTRARRLVAARGRFIRKLHKTLSKNGTGRVETRFIALRRRADFPEKRNAVTTVASPFHGLA